VSDATAAPVAQLVPWLGADVRPTAVPKNSRESAPANRLPACPSRSGAPAERRAGAELAARAARLRAALVAELDGGKLLDDTPKSRASRRTVAIPAEIIPDLQAHLDTFAEFGPDGRVFVGPRGGPLRRSGFRRIWNQTRADVGFPDLHFHDLRHVGNTLAATTGASLKELMARMGHASPRAALIYQHASQDRDKVIAQALGEALKTVRPT
jgi:integrase